MTILNYSNHKEAIELHESLHEPLTSFSSPLLDQFNITWFGYVRLFPDGSRFIINKKKGWLLDYIQKDFHNDCVQTENLDINYQAAEKTLYYSLWSGLKKSKVFDFFYEENIFNGCYFHRRRKEGSEVFSFATTRDNIAANDFYINNINFLNYVVFLFKEKFSSVINNIHQKTIILPTNCYDKEKQLLPLFATTIQKQLPSFYNKTEIKRLYFNKAPQIYATKQECFCLELLSKGFTEKETASALNLSIRTVESYLNSLKNKLRCQYKSQLLEIYSHGFHI
jgi:DNA-binding CsgD family transcriptional regulator